MLWMPDALSHAAANRTGVVVAGVALGPVAFPSGTYDADRGFFGSRPFSRANALLAEQGAEPVNWLRG